VLLHNTGTGAATLAGNRSAFVFRPFGKRATNGTLVYCDRRREAAARALVISYTGRPRVAAEGPAGRDLDCPAPPQ
jgi:type IV fimbrial biogenesis protein FimT